MLLYDTWVRACQKVLRSINKPLFGVTPVFVTLSVSVHSFSSVLSVQVTRPVVLNRGAAAH